MVKYWMINMISIIEVIRSFILLIKVVVLFKWICRGVSLLLFLLMEVIICFYLVLSLIFVINMVFCLFCILYFDKRNGLFLFFFIGKFFFVMVDLLIDRECFFMRILLVGIWFLMVNGIMLFMMRLKMDIVCFCFVWRIFNFMFFFLVFKFWKFKFCL